MTNVTAIIDENGEITIEVNGLKGSACKKLTEELINSLGEVKETKLTSEYYQKPLASVKVK